MPEGDTLFRIAAALRPYLVGRAVVAASARQPGPRADLLVGRTVTEVVAIGKNLVIRFDSGLELRTHLGMRGSWHRYRPGERMTIAGQAEKLRGMGWIPRHASLRAALAYLREGSG